MKHLPKLVLTLFVAALFVFAAYGQGQSLGPRIPFRVEEGSGSGWFSIPRSDDPNLIAIRLTLEYESCFDWVDNHPVSTLPLAFKAGGGTPIRFYYRRDLMPGPILGGYPASDLWLVGGVSLRFPRPGAGTTLYVWTTTQHPWLESHPGYLLAQQGLNFTHRWPVTETLLLTDSEHGMPLVPPYLPAFRGTGNVSFYTGHTNGYGPNRGAMTFYGTVIPNPSPPVNETQWGTRFEPRYPVIHPYIDGSTMRWRAEYYRD